MSEDEGPVIVSLAVIFAAVIGIALILVREAPQCQQSHVERVHRDAYTSFMYVGNRPYPVYNPASDTDETVCDTYN